MKKHHFFAFVVCTFSFVCIGICSASTRGPEGTYWKTNLRGPEGTYWKAKIAQDMVVCPERSHKMIGEEGTYW